MSVFRGKAAAQMGTDVPPAGNQPAVAVALIDLGTHEESFQGGDPKKRHTVYLLFELTDAPVDGQDRNHVIGSRYTLSYAPSAALRQLVEAVRKKPFADGENIEYDKLLGKPCYVNVEHVVKGDRTYASLKGVTPVPLVKGKPVEVSPPRYTPFVFEIGSGSVDKDIAAKSWLPWCYGETLTDVIKRSDEYLASIGKTPAPKGKPAEDEGEAEAVGPDGNPLEDAPW